MKDITKIIIAIGMVGAFIVGFLANNQLISAVNSLNDASASLREQSQQLGAGVYSNANVFGAMATSGQVSVSTDIRLLATSSLRRQVLITPAASCTQGAYIGFYNDAPVTTATGYFLAASSSFIMDSGAIYTGSVRAISNGGTCPLNVIAAQ